MTEGTHIPGTAACTEWEAKLTDALDGLLNPQEKAKFEAHIAACPACADLYEDARRGSEWLKFLSPEPEPPAGLLEKILARTGPDAGLGTVAETDFDRPGSGLPAGVGAVPSFVPPIWQQPGFMARPGQSAGPRLLMTAAMAIFSIGLTLNLVGTDLSHLRTGDLRPQALRSYMERQLTMASVPIVRYYDHLRIVHELESRVRELRNENESEDNGEQQQMQPATPGESRNNWRPVNRETGEQAIKQPENREINGSLEEVRHTPLASLTERSTPWTA